MKRCSVRFARRWTQQGAFNKELLSRRTWRIEALTLNTTKGARMPVKTMAAAGKAARVFFALALLVAAGIARAELAGPVVAVLDGDTIDVLIDRQPVRVRLAQIDAPEKRQAFGTRSRQALSSLVFRQSVTVADAGRDRYGRVLGTVCVSGVNVNAEMVRQGMAWVYRQYATDRSLFALEDEARAGRRGLWADPSPVPPWQFRHRQHE